MTGAPARSTASRWAGVSHRAARAILLALALLIVASILRYYTTGSDLPIERAAAPVLPETGLPDRDPDLTLYRKITERVANGEDYYSAAARELRSGNYPLKPFVTFRLPTMAHLGAALGPSAMLLLLYGVMAVTLLAWWRRLDGVFDDPGRRLTGIMLIGAGMAVGFSGQYVGLHDLWSGILIALSIALHRDNRAWPAIMIAGLALFIRELALPFVLLMGAFALYRRNWREVAGWTLLVLAFGLVLFLHMRCVAAVVLPSDPSSPGWTSLSGWSGFLRMMTETGPFRGFPHWIAIIATILALFGWASWKSITGLFCMLFFGGYALIFMVLGRPDNFYWGLMVAPTLLLGLAFLPQAFADLRTALGPVAKLDLRPE